ncbi:MAG TPA: YidB family protein [Methylocella sp.]|nr:YidB family protein [Methylocella sp.]
MENLAELAQDITVRFDLGPEAHTILHELCALISGGPGGVNGFLKRVSEAGLETKAASWLGSSYPMALSANELRRVFGETGLRQMAKDTGLGEASVTMVAGYAIPKVVGLFAADIAVSRSTRHELPQKPRQRAARKKGSAAMIFRLGVPAVAALLTFAVLGYAISSGDRSDVGAAPNVAETAFMPRHEALAKETKEKGGVLVERMAESQAPSTLGSGPLAVSAGWVENLTAMRAIGKGEMAELSLAQEAMAHGPVHHTIGTTIDRALLVPRFVAATLVGSGPAHLQLAAAPQPAEPRRLSSIELPSIPFEANSARISPPEFRLLRRVAHQIKELPPGTTVEIDGLVHGTAASRYDEELARRRADAVREVLIRQGVNPAMLYAKGVLVSAALANNGGELAEGRSSKPNENDRFGGRRVDFRVISPGS